MTLVSEPSWESVSEIRIMKRLHEEVIVQTVAQQSLNVFFLRLTNQEICTINKKWGGAEQLVINVGSA